MERVSQILELAVIVKCRGVREAELDGRPVDFRAIPFVEDGGTHRVVVTLGPA